MAVFGILCYTMSIQTIGGFTMIKTEIIRDSQERCRCCNNPIRFGVLNTINNDKSLGTTRLPMCEDCACAMANMFFKTVETEEPYKFVLEEGYIEKL
jgi:hypothetical protein